MIKKLLNLYLKNKYFKRIVCLHSIDDSTFSPKKLESFFKLLKVLNIKIVSLSEILTINTQGKYVAFTLDDGYKNNIKNVVPILQKYKVKACMFIVPGLMDLKSNDPKLLSNNMYPNQSTINNSDLEKWINCSMEIGFHTNTHLDLYEADNKLIKNDFMKGLNKLKELTNKDIRYFAYPIGYLPQNRTLFKTLLKDNFITHAFTIEWKNVDSIDNFYIGRVALGDGDNLLKLIFKTIGLLDFYYKLKFKNKKNTR